MAFVAASTGQTVKAVLFDVFGTVVDWRTGVAAAVRRFAGEHGLELDADGFADAWRARYVPGMRRVSSGERPFVLLDVLHRENLDGVLADLGVDPGRFGPAALDELNHAWHFLPPWPDSVAGIAALKRNFIVGPLSNGNTSLLLDMAKAGGLAWDLILGSDVTKAYKPTTEAYLRPAALLGLEPGEIMLAAAHESDLAAARTAGLAAAFISRPLENGPGVPGAGVAAQSWDLAVSSITELAEQLGPRLRGCSAASTGNGEYLTELAALVAGGSWALPSESHDVLVPLGGKRMEREVLRKVHMKCALPRFAEHGSSPWPFRLICMDSAARMFSPSGA